MKILITGGVGFIGTNTAKHFATHGHEVVIVDDFSRVGVDANAKYLKQTFPSITIIKSDVRQLEDYLDNLKKCEVVIHLAGQTAVTTSLKYPEADFQVNAYGTFLLLDALRQYNLQAIFLYASTNKVYGDLAHHDLTLDKNQKQYLDLNSPNGIDESERLQFLSPYGCSKGSADQYTLDAYHSFGLKTVVFRQSCIYGEHQIGVEDQGWLAFFSYQFMKKKPITIFGDGYQVRDLLYVQDLIEAYALAIDKIDQVAGEVFNIGGGQGNAYSLIRVIYQLSKIYDYQVPVSYSQKRTADQKYFVSDNAKLQKLLGWLPTTNFSNGLLKMINWQKNNL